MILLKSQTLTTEFAWNYSICRPVRYSSKNSSVNSSDFSTQIFAKSKIKSVSSCNMPSPYLIYKPKLRKFILRQQKQDKKKQSINTEMISDRMWKGYVINSWWRQLWTIPYTLFGARFESFKLKFRDCVFLCVCVREREGVCMCVRERECVYVWERECVCMWERECVCRERDDLKILVDPKTV